MHGLGLFLLISIQVVCVVHVIKRGRPFWWLWLIILVPFIGCLVYFIVELLPDMQRSGAVRGLGSDIASIVDPTRNLRKLEEELQISDTIKNRQGLARGYLNAGRHQEAIDLYQSCLTGIYQDDPGMMLELSLALFLNGACAEAKETLQRLRADNPAFRASEQQLLFARTLEQLGELDDALEEYASLAKRYSGAEAQCRYALLLKRTGQAEKARAEFNDILVFANRSPAYYRKAQRQWIRIAKENRR